MRHIVCLVVGFLLFTAVSASAQAQPVMQRSPSRVAGWLGVAAAGGALLFYARPCGVVGSLGKPVTVYAGSYWSRATISGKNLVPFSDNGACGIDFSVNARLDRTGRMETVQYATLDGAERLAATLVRGTAAGQKRWRNKILMPAVGLIGLGIVGAIVLSDVPVVQNIAVAPLPGGARITSSFGF